MKTLPIIDVSRLNPAELGRACREIGFFYVIHHGIPAATRDAMFAASRQFFTLPVAAKEQYSIKRSQHNRGYVGLGEERLNQAADHKEAFNIGLELGAGHPDVTAGKPFRGVNLWPDLPHWRETALAYYDACWALGRRIHCGFALDLGIAEDFFEDKLDAPLATLRMLHYPPQPERHTSAPGSGAGAHTDYGNLTILATDGIAGLQVRTRGDAAGGEAGEAAGGEAGEAAGGEAGEAAGGEWIDAPHIEGAFVCNIGDCLMRWTNDVYLSTPHRVAIPVKDRYSIAFFLDPNPDARVEVLPNCIPPGAAPRYRPTTGAAYLRERLTATYDHLKQPEQG